MCRIGIWLQCIKALTHWDIHSCRISWSNKFGLAEKCKPKGFGHLHQFVSNMIFKYVWECILCILIYFMFIFIHFSAFTSEKWKYLSVKNFTKLSTISFHYLNAIGNLQEKDWHHQVFAVHVFRSGTVLYSIYVTERISCTFCEIVQYRLGVQLFQLTTGGRHGWNPLRAQRGVMKCEQEPWAAVSDPTFDPHRVASCI